MSAYTEFTARLKLHFSKNPTLLVNTLSNIFSMRLFGNKTHSDLAELLIQNLSISLCTILPLYMQERLSIAQRAMKKTYRSRMR